MLALEQRKKVIIFSIHDKKNGEATIAPGSSAWCGFIYEALKMQNS